MCWPFHHLAVNWNLAGGHNTYDSVKVDDDAPAGLLMLIMMLMEMMLLLMMIMVILGRPSWSRRLKLGLEAIKQVPLGCRPLSLSLASITSVTIFNWEQV